MKNRWINLKEAEAIRNQNIVLFGAGNGSKEYIHFSHQNSLNNKILCVIDNDPSHWGKSFNGFEVCSPERLLKSCFDCIVVTSISGREAIARQLEAMNFKYGRDYVLIGRFPRSYKNQFEVMRKSLSTMFSLKGKKVLHIGPGGFLGFEVLLYCYGVNRVYSVDNNPFGIQYPDITKHYKEYMEIRDILNSGNREEKTSERTFSRFDSLFKQRKMSYFLDKQKISYRYPMDVCHLNFPDESFDAVFSFAVLEHVTKPPLAVKEMARVLKKDGLMFHTIVTRDHRSFSMMDGYHPFSFRTYSPEQWEEICSNKFYQNRILPLEWKALFKNCDLTLLKYSVGSNLEIDDRMFEAFHPDFRKFSRKALGEVDCTILALK